MKRKVLSILVVCAHISFAQSIDYNKIILPKNTQNVDLVEKLVQIAWQNNPQNEVFRNDVAISQHNLGKARAGWLSKVTVGGNLNEFTLDRSSERSQFYPRYNFGLHFTLGSFVDVPKDKKIAKEQIKNAQAQLNSQKLLIRSEVIKRYETYKLNVEINKVQNEAAEDAYTLYLQTEQKFRNGDLGIEDFNRATNYYNQERIKKFSSEIELKISQASLEELLGVKLEDVM